MSPTTMIQQSVFSTKSLLPPPPLKDFGENVTVFKQNNPGQYIKVSKYGTKKERKDVIYII